MNKENTEKLVKRFPVLYQGFYDPCSVTCMCWGFEHGDGWFSIIWQLSLALEDELKYTWAKQQWFLVKKRFSTRWNDLVYKISPPWRQNTKLVKGADNVWRHEKLPTPPEKFPWAKKFIVHPNTGFAVTQVKEKFGGLRFYSPINDRISHLVSLAERAASNTCEECGDYGRLRINHGWYKTLCKNCRNKIYPVADNECLREFTSGEVCRNAPVVTSTFETAHGPLRLCEECLAEFPKYEQYKIQIHS